MIDNVVNSGEDDDVEPATDEEALVMAERLNDRRVLLAAFLKLTMFQVIDAKMAAPVWGYFISVSVDTCLYPLKGTGLTSVFPIFCLLWVESVVKPFQPGV